jgi:glucose-1-phosphate cytidylyltransferase
MKVLILAGGKGSRMNEETEIKPKPLIEIGERPILWHVMKIYAQSGFFDFVVLTGYKSHMIVDYFDENPEKEWNIEFLDTGLETKKAQRIKMAEHLITEDNFFVAYGDDLSDIDPGKIIDYHNSHGKMVTLAAIPLESNFGVVELTNDNSVRRFREKPKIDGYWINGGFFCFKREILGYLNNEDELEDEVFKMLAQKDEIKAIKHDGFWKCMNTKKEYQEFNKLYKENIAPWIRSS